MKLKTAQKLQAQGRLTRAVLTEEGWYAPGPLKVAPAPFAEVSDEDVIVVIPKKALPKIKHKVKAVVVVKAAPAKKAKRKVVAKRKAKKHG